MASIFGHGLVAYTLSKTIDSKSDKRLLFLAIGSAILPDADVVAFLLDIPYAHPLGHRGFTHSIFFAIFWALLLAFSLGKHRKIVYFLVLFLSTISHGILDALTTGGKGVGFLIPFNTDRFFFPWHIIKVSPLGVQFFSERGIQVLLSELKYVGIPCAILLIFTYFLRRKNDETGNVASPETERENS